MVNLYKKKQIPGKMRERREMIRTLKNNSEMKQLREVFRKFFILFFFISLSTSHSYYYFSFTILKGVLKKTNFHLTITDRNIKIKSIMFAERKSCQSF